MISASQQEARAAVGVVGVLLLDLLEGDLAVQLLVAGDEDLAQAALGVRPQDAKTRAGRRRVRPPNCARVAEGSASFARGHMGQAGVHVLVGQAFEVLAHGAGRAHGVEAPLRVVAVLLEVLEHEGVEQGAAFGVQGALVLEDLRQGRGLIEQPGLHPGQERVLAHEGVLVGEDAEKKIAVGLSSGHGGAPREEGIRG